jgi:hypothetical protein
LAGSNGSTLPGLSEDVPITDPGVSQIAGSYIVATTIPLTLRKTVAINRFKDRRRRNVSNAPGLRPPAWRHSGTRHPCDHLGKAEPTVTSCRIVARDRWHSATPGRLRTVGEIAKTLPNIVMLRFDFGDTPQTVGSWRVHKCRVPKIRGWSRGALSRVSQAIDRCHFDWRQPRRFEIGTYARSVAVHSPAIFQTRSRRCQGPRVP